MTGPLEKRLHDSQKPKKGAKPIHRRKINCFEHFKLWKPLWMSLRKKNKPPWTSFCSHKNFPNHIHGLLIEKSQKNTGDVWVKCTSKFFHYFFCFRKIANCSFFGPVVEKKIIWGEMMQSPKKLNSSTLDSKAEIDFLGSGANPLKDLLV